MRLSDEPGGGAVAERLARIDGDAEHLAQLWESGTGVEEMLYHVAALRSEIGGAKKAVLEYHLDLCAVGASEGKPMDQVVARLISLLDRSA